MVENNKVTNGFKTDYREVISPVFDFTARRTARKVEPLSSVPFEATHRARVTQAFTQTPLNSDIYQNPQMVSNYAPPKPKSRLLLKIFLITILIVFALGGGAVGGFALAQYQNKKEEKGIALIPQPMLKKFKDVPNLTLEVYEDPNEIPEETEETTDENTDGDENQTQPNKPSTPNTPRPQKSPNQQTPDESNNNQQHSPPQEQRERKVGRPNQSNTNDNRNGQRPNRDESVFKKLKRIIEQL